MITPLVGNVYIVHHSSGNIKARFIRDVVYNPGAAWIEWRSMAAAAGRSTHHYLFQNLSSGREIIIKSRVKIRSQVTDGSI